MDAGQIKTDGYYFFFFFFLVITISDYSLGKSLATKGFGQKNFLTLKASIPWDFYFLWLK